MNNINSDKAIYIAGPMAKAYDDHNHDAFCRAVCLWKGKPYAFGQTVSAWNIIQRVSERYIGDMQTYNFRHIDAVISDADALAAAQRIEMEELRSCSAIYLLRGWEHSEWARHVLKAAIELGMEIILEGQA